MVNGRPPDVKLNFETLTACPLCGSTSMTMADQDYNICTCSCGYVCDNPRPTLKSISDFYSAKGKYASWVVREAPYARLWRRRLKKILRYAKQGKILDIGAGTGQFLSIAQPHFTDVFGTELSSSGAAVAKEKYNLVLTVGDIHSLSLPSSFFDNITLFHVLEHVHDPITMLARSWDLLSPGGMLFVCVPNDVLSWGSRIKALGNRLKIPAFQKFSPRFGVPLIGTSSEIHLSHFTPDALSAAVRKAGFDVCEIGLDPYFAASWAWTVPHFGYMGFQSLIYKLTRTNHYETIMLIAKKPNA